MFFGLEAGIIVVECLCMNDVILAHIQRKTEQNLLFYLFQIKKKNKTNPKQQNQGRYVAVSGRFMKVLRKHKLWK